MKRFYFCALAALLGAVSATGAHLFALDTAMVRDLGRDKLTRSDIEVVARLGYSGVAPVALDAPGWEHVITEVLPWLEERKLKLTAVYSWVSIDRTGVTWAPGLREALPKLKGHGTILWLNVKSKDFHPSDFEADRLAVKAIGDLADIASLHGVQVSLYPHTRDLAEKVTDVVRLADKANRPNLTVTFNLCHWLRNEGADSLDEVLDLAMPRLSLVTINGADRDGKEWIQPLDQGDYPVQGLLKALKKRGYRGLIGLQGYNVAKHYSITPEENLRRSMTAWKKLRY